MTAFSNWRTLTSVQAATVSILALTLAACGQSRENATSGETPKPAGLYRMSEEDVCDHAFWDQNENAASQLKLQVRSLTDGAADSLTSYIGSERCSRAGWKQLVESVEGIKWAIAWLPTMLNPVRTGCKPEHLADMRKFDKVERPDAPFDATEVSSYLESHAPPHSTFDLARYIDRGMLDRLPRRSVIDQDLQLDERLCRCRQRDGKKLFDSLRAAREELALWLKDTLPRVVAEKCGKQWLSDDDFPAIPVPAEPM